MAKKDKDEPKKEVKKAPEVAGGVPTKIIVWFIVGLLALFVLPIMFKGCNSKPATKTTAEEKESGGGFLTINLGKSPMDAESKKNAGEVKKVTLSTTQWSEVVDIPEGKSFALNSEGKIGVAINNGIRFYEYDKTTDKLYVLDKDCKKVRNQRTGRDLEAENFGHTVMDMRFMSLDVEEKLVQVTIR